MQRRTALKRTPLAKQSKKRQSEQYAYQKAKGELVAKTGGQCEARVTGICTGYASDLHHLKFRSRGASYVPGEDEARILCRACHSWVHANTREARALGLLR